MATKTNRKASSMNPKFMFKASGFKHRENEVQFNGKVKMPKQVKEIASDMTVIGDVLVEAEYDNESVFFVTINPRPTSIDLPLFNIAMMKHGITSFVALKEGRLKFPIFIK